MAQHADQALPGAAFFFAQGAAHIRQHDQRVRHAVLAEGAFAHHPARIGSRVRKRDQRFVSGFEAGIEFKLGRGLAQQPRGGLLQQALAGRIHQAQDVIRIEGEQRRVNLFHHAAQQCSGFDGLDALLGENVGEGIDFQCQLAQSVVRSSSAGAKRIVFLA